MQTSSITSVRRVSLLRLRIAALLAPSLARTRAAGPCSTSAAAAGAGNGSSWADACGDLQATCADASYSEIWAVESYRPTTGDRAATQDRKAGLGPRSVHGRLQRRPAGAALPRPIVEASGVAPARTDAGKPTPLSDTLHTSPRRAELLHGRSIRAAASLADIGCSLGSGCPWSSVEKR